MYDVPGGGLRVAPFMSQENYIATTNNLGQRVRGLHGATNDIGHQLKE